VRSRCRLRAIASLLCAGAAASAAGAASNQVAHVSASVVKPLTLAHVQDLDLGSIVLGPGTWTGATVAISRGGVFSCANANVICTGATQVAKYNVTGSNNQAVRITAPNVVLTNQNDPAQTLMLVVDSPGSVTLTSSGNKGQNFALGGSISLSSSTAPGVYAGTFNVTVDY
jgi:spore coat protein U-like protein